MRQAGRYLPGYREIRKNYSVLEAARNPELCRDITLMPVKELGVDAAVMFADIMLPLDGMGVKFKIEENVGPIIENPIASLEHVDKLRDFNPKENVPYTLEAIRLVRARLDNNALVGFAGAPFTVASYLIEGGPSREFSKTKKIMFDNREMWRLLMTKLARMTSKYLSAQIDAGVDVVQLFDSWVGALSPEDYKEYVSPYVTEVFGFITKNHPSTPKIHFGTNTRHLLALMRDNGGDVLSVDWRFPLDEARKIVGDSFGIQGNLEPAVLLSSDSDFIANRAQKVLDKNGGRNGHVFNLGHGILRDTPVENAKFVVEYVHNR